MDIKYYTKELQSPTLPAPLSSQPARTMKESLNENIRHFEFPSNVKNILHILLHLFPREHNCFLPETSKC